MMFTSDESKRNFVRCDTETNGGFYHFQSGKNERLQVTASEILRIVLI